MSSSQQQDRSESERRVSRPAIVVIAEDNDDTRKVYGLILRHYGYHVVEAANGAQAIDVVRATKPDLVLMDIGLPGMDGWQASKVLKADAETSGIPLIAFSARVDSTADLAAGMVTFDGYILKPISPLDLVRRVDAYLDLIGGVREVEETRVTVPLDLTSGGGETQATA